MSEYEEMISSLRRAGHRVGDVAVARLSPRDSAIADGVALALTEYCAPLERRISALELVVLEKVASPHASSTAALKFWA